MEPLPTPNLAPTGEEKENKEAHINMRIAATDKRAIEAKAKRAGLSVTEYLRRAGLGRAIVERVPPELRRLLGATSGNLNQLTKLASAGQLPGLGIEELNDLVTRLRQTLK
jgi:hypothetical protein